MPDQTDAADQPAALTGGQWHCLDLFGHTRLAGYLTIVEEAGVALYRLHIPAVNGKQARTIDYHPNAVYSKEPIDEETARRLVELHPAETPINVWSARQMVRESASPLALGGPDPDHAHEWDGQEDDDSDLEDD